MIPSPIIIPKKETFKINGKTYIDTGKKFQQSSFGDIYLVQDEKQQYILKSAKKFLEKKDTDKNFEMLEKEYDLLAAVDKCPHIIKVEGFLGDKDYAMMLLQYAKGGDLLDYINSKIETKTLITLETFDNLFRQLIIAIKCIHSLGVYNRDIKLDNIVFLDKEQTQLAIIDFGLAVKSDTDDCYKSVGTDGYKAVEVRNYSYSTFKCSKADIFALGKTLVYLFMLIKKDDSDYYEKMEQLITQMCEEKPEERISLDDIIKKYDEFSDKKIVVVNIKVEDEDNFSFVFKAKKSLQKSKQIKRKSKSLRKSKQIKRKSKSLRKSKQIKRKSKSQ